MGKEFVLTSITLYNMFNYRKKHKIDFTGGRDGNVFLFDVKNGGGENITVLLDEMGILWIRFRSLIRQGRSDSQSQGFYESG